MDSVVYLSVQCCLPPSAVDSVVYLPVQCCLPPSTVLSTSQSCGQCCLPPSAVDSVVYLSVLWTGWFLPQRNTTDAVELQLPLQHLSDLALLRALLHLLSANQIDAPGGQDEVPPHGLCVRIKVGGEEVILDVGQRYK